MNFFLITIHFLVYLAASISYTRAVEIYNGLNPSNVLIRYTNYQDSETLVIVDLTQFGEHLKIIATEEADIPGAPETSENQASEETNETQNRTDEQVLRHGKEFINFKVLREATILYGPRDVECYFFYYTMREGLMPEESRIRHPIPLKPFTRFIANRGQERFVAIQCEGPVDRVRSST